MPSTKRRKENPRRAEFRAALALNKETASSWALRNEITPTHLSLVLSGGRASDRLDRKIDSYIEDFRNRMSTLHAARSA